MHIFQSPITLKDAVGIDRADGIDTSVSAADNISRLISALRRHTRLVIVFCLAGAAAGILYIIVSTPLYTATAQIVIDNRQVRSVHDVSTLSDWPVEMAGFVDSQVELLRSEEVGLAVVKSLNLVEDPAFVDPPKSWIRKIWASVMIRLGAIIGPTGPVNKADPSLSRQQIALATLNKNLHISRVGASFVVAVAYTLPDPVRAAEIANAYTNAYMLAQLKSANDETHRAGIWLQQRAEELRQLSVNADLVAQKFKADNNLLGAKGMLIAEQQLNEMTTELVKARAATAEARARYGRFPVSGQTLRGDAYEIAAAREKDLAESLKQQQNISVVANDAQAQLRQLELKAESYKLLYQSYMQRFQETAQHESYPVADAHVASPARPPAVPSYPRIPVVLSISLALGTLAGAGVAMLRRYTDDVFRTVEQVHDELGVDVLGFLPVVPAASRPRRAGEGGAPILRYVIDNRFSEFAETLRSAKVAADQVLQDRSPKIIGVVSFLPSEGKSTVAKNFASLLALQGARTLLVDADTRNPSLTRAIGCERRQDSESNPLPPLTELLVDEPESGVQILPCIYAAQDPRAADGLSPAMIEALLRSKDRCFDYVVIDLPPIGPAVSARGLGSAIDAFIFVVTWGTTPRGAVRAALVQEHSIRNKLLGVILNKVDIKMVKTYEHYRSAGYYRKDYESYFKHAERGRWK
ncbi:MAG: Wzz/FepE/Etk N-terminal domain-containing protein [Gammaproteobacteria bacterium]